MEITKTIRDQITVLSVQGQLDAITAPALERELQALSGTGAGRFIVDLGGVQLISSAALRVLLSAAKFTKKQQGQILLCSLTPEVKKVFELSGLTNLFNLQPTLDDALKSLGVEDAPPAPAATGEPPAPPALKEEPAPADVAPEPPPAPPAPPVIAPEPASDATLEDVSPKEAAAAMMVTMLPPAEEAAPAAAIPPPPPPTPPVIAPPPVAPPPALVFDPAPVAPPPTLKSDPDATLPPPEPAPAPVIPPPPVLATEPPPPAPVVAPPPPVAAPPPPRAATPPPPIPAPVASARPVTPPPPTRPATPPPPIPAPVASARPVTPPAATPPPPPPSPIARTAPRQQAPLSKKSSNLTIIVAGASVVFLGLCVVVALMLRHSNSPRPAPTPTPAVAEATPSPAETVEPPGPTVSLPPATTPAGNVPPATGTAIAANAPPAPDGVQAPAAVNLNADDAASQETRKDVLKRIDVMPVSQATKDRLYKAVDTAKHMGKLMTVGFETGQSDLGAAAVANLKKTLARPDLQKIVSDPSVVVVILGFADSKGAAQKNKEISERRAERTMKALRESCGLENVMHDIGMGGSEFLAKGNTEKNRVAEVWVVAP